jgi:hypothetical protein
MKPDYTELANITEKGVPVTIDISGAANGYYFDYRVQRIFFNVDAQGKISGINQSYIDNGVVVVSGNHLTINGIKISVTSKLSEIVSNDYGYLRNPGNGKVANNISNFNTATEYTLLPGYWGFMYGYNQFYFNLNAEGTISMYPGYEGYETDGAVTIDGTSIIVNGKPFTLASNLTTVGSLK